MAKDLKETIVEQGDTIALFVTAIIAIILVSLEILPEKFVDIFLLLILCLLALHMIRRTFKIEKMHKQIERMNTIVEKLIGETKPLAEKGIIDIAMRRSDIPIKEMQRDVETAKSFFLLSRYFSIFSQKTARQTIINCLNNGGNVRIITYSPKGSHMNVKTEPDLDPQMAKERISQTLQHLKRFKQKLSPNAQERFQYKVLEGHIIYIWIQGSEKKIYATIYLNDLRGDECPTIICKPVAGLAESVYSEYSEEFEKLWKIAEEPD